MIKLGPQHSDSLGAAGSGPAPCVQAASRHPKGRCMGHLGLTESAWRYPRLRRAPRGGACVRGRGVRIGVGGQGRDVPGRGPRRVVATGDRTRHPESAVAGRLAHRPSESARWRPADAAHSRPSRHAGCWRRVTRQACRCRPRPALRRRGVRRSVRAIGDGQPLATSARTAVRYPLAFITTAAFPQRPCSAVS